MKVLTFNDVRNYEILYEGLLSVSTKGAETRTLSRILTKLERIGVKKEVNGRESLLYTLAEPGPVKFEESEFEFTKKKLNEVEWNGAGAKSAGALLEWLDEKHPSEEEYAALKDGVLKLEKPSA